MIEEHIKFNEEPKPVIYTPTTYHSSNMSVSWPTKSAEQKAAWVKLINEEYIKSISLYRVGDTVSLATNVACVVEIARFETDPEKCMSYNGFPCVIKGIIKSWQNPNEISYSLQELNWQSLVPCDVVSSLSDGNANGC